MEIEKIYKSRWFKGGACAIIVLILLLLVFQLGVFVGYKKAGFSYKWGENYYKNFAGEREGFMRDMPRDRDFMAGHGIAGSILNIDLTANMVSIKGNNGVEQIVLLTAQTEIKRIKDNVKIDELKSGDNIVVIGAPNSNGQIVASLIRIMPAPPSGVVAPGQPAQNQPVPAEGNNLEQK